MLRSSGSWRLLNFETEQYVLFLPTGELVQVHGSKPVTDRGPFREIASHEGERFLLGEGPDDRRSIVFMADLKAPAALITSDERAGYAEPQLRLNCLGSCPSGRTWPAISTPPQFWIYTRTFRRLARMSSSRAILLSVVGWPRRGFAITYSPVTGPWRFGDGHPFGRIISRLWTLRVTSSVKTYCL